MNAMDLPKTQKAWVYDVPGTISTKKLDIPMPDPGPGEVLIQLYGRSAQLNQLPT